MISSRQFDAKARAMKAELAVAKQKEMRSQARLLVRDLIKLTPPFGPHAINESASSQQKIGAAAVARDVRKVFMPIEQMDMVRNPRNRKLADALLRAAGIAKRFAVGRSGVRRRTGGVQAAARGKSVVEAILRRAGVRSPVLLKASRGVHLRARGARGHVYKGNRHIVIDAKSVGNYIREAQAHVGRAKAGWATAASALGQSVPAYVRRAGQFGAPGVIVDQSKAPRGFIRVGNRVPYRGDFDVLTIVKSAEKLRQKLFRKRMGFIWRGIIRKYNR